MSIVTIAVAVVSVVALILAIVALNKANAIKNQLGAHNQAPQFPPAYPSVSGPPPLPGQWPGTPPRP